MGKKSRHKDFYGKLPRGKGAGDAGGQEDQGHWAWIRNSVASKARAVVVTYAEH